VQFDLSSYAQVADRLVEFYKLFPDGSIRTSIVKDEDGEVVIRAKVYRTREDVRDGVYTSGFAREVEGKTPVNRTSHVENCVPLSVPALTRLGWRFYHQLRVGEEVLTYNVGTGVMEWRPLLAVTEFGKRALVRIGNSRFSADCTPEHRWVINGRLMEWRSACIGRGGQKITIAARLAESEMGNVEDAARLGWIFGDCTIGYSNGLPSRATVVQSKPQYFEELDALFGERHLKAAAGMRDWGAGLPASAVLPGYGWAVPAATIRRVLGRYGIAGERDLVQAVCRMTSAELDAFLDGMLKSDGSRGVYAKTSPDLCEAVQLAMFLTGHATGAITERAAGPLTTKPCYTVPMHRTGAKYLSEFTEETIPPQQVWCPTTENGTWVGRFNGRPAITGNCETSAIGRALANLGFAASTKRPSRTEMEKTQRQTADHDSYLAYIRSASEQGGADLMVDVSGRSLALQEYVKEMWRKAKERIQVAKQLAAVVERATGIPLHEEAA
jgi:hypothetical protein